MSTLTPDTFATRYVADLAPGDRFLNPATGELVTFVAARPDIGAVESEARSGRRRLVFLDPARLVNLPEEPHFHGA
jgi:hypothetical protein